MVLTPKSGKGEIMLAWPSLRFEGQSEADLSAVQYEGELPSLTLTMTLPKGEPIKLDYRLDKFDADWKIIDVNVAGIWLVTSYRSQFATEITASGLDGLINKLAERNKAAAKS